MGGRPISLPEFEYVAPISVRDAVTALVAAGQHGRVIAGGQSLLPRLRTWAHPPKVLVDIGRIPALRTVEEDDVSVVLGAMVTHHEVAGSDVISQHIRLLSNASVGLADPQVRHRGTLGGALSNANPAGDIGAVALALEAELTIEGPDGASRVVAAEDFFIDRFTTVLSVGELLTQIRIRKHTGWGAHYEKFARMAHRWTVVGVAATARIDNGTFVDVRIGLANMASVPLRARLVEQALVGRPATLDVIKSAAMLVPDGIDPPSDLDGDAQYRRRLLPVLTRRAVIAAAGTDTGSIK